MTHLESHIPAFVINLDQAADRLEFMHQQAASASIRFERVRGNWGVDIEPLFIRDKFVHADGSLKTRLRPGQIGCYSSHLKTHALIAERNLPMALVLEDDVVLPADFSQILKKIIGNLPPSWDIVKLCNDPKRAVFSVRRVDDRHLVRFTRQPSRGGAYLISRNGAFKMLRANSRPFPFDGELSRPWRFGLDVYGICPAPVRQIDLPSATTAQGGRTKVWKSPWQRTRALVYAISKVGVNNLIACRLAEARGTFKRNRPVPMIVE